MLIDIFSEFEGSPYIVVQCLHFPFQQEMSFKHCRHSAHDQNSPLIHQLASWQHIFSLI